LELALGNQRGRHPEAVKDPAAHAPPTERATGDDEPAAQLRPRDTLVNPPATAVTLEHLVRVNDPAPRDDKTGLGPHLERDRTRPRHVVRHSRPDRGGWGNLAGAAYATHWVRHPRRHPRTPSSSSSSGAQAPHLTSSTNASMRVIASATNSRTLLSTPASWRN